MLAIFAFIGICYLIISAHMPLTGDDLVYGPLYTLRYHGVAGYALYIAQHWLSTNGRIANLIAPLMLNYIPHWALLLLNAAITALMFVAVINLACTQRVGITARLLLISILAYTLPWWDSMLLFDCSFNYVWATTFGLFAIYAILNHRCNNILLAIFAFLAAGMHEAMGVPLSCGLIAYLLFTRAHKSLSTLQRLPILAFFAGSAFVFLSRGLWSRFGAIQEVNDPMPLLVLKSDFFVIALIILVIVAYITDRQRLIKAIHSPWIIFAVAALASCTFSAVSGIVGRSGWFAQIYALIAIYLWADTYNWHISRPSAITLTLIMAIPLTIHYIEFTRYQITSGTQLAQSIQQYTNSPDGIVYGDYLGDPDKPWWTLHKTRGVPDADDNWVLATITQCYGNPSRPLTILPTALRTLDPRTITTTLTPVGANFVTTTIPQGTTPQMRYTHAGTQYVVVPFTRDNITLYLITPLDLDPGDR